MHLTSILLSEQIKLFLVSKLPSVQFYTECPFFSFLSGELLFTLHSPVPKSRVLMSFACCLQAELLACQAGIPWP